MAAVRPRISPTFVEAHQRRRAVVAVAELAHERGVAAITVADICRQARIGRVHFYHLFDSHSACLRQACEEAFRTTFGPVAAVASAEHSKPWAARLEAGIGTFFAAVAAEPLQAELCLVHSPTAPGGEVEHDVEAGVEILARLLHGGRETNRKVPGGDSHEPGAPVEEYLARAIVALARLQVRRGSAAQLPGQCEEMVQLINGFSGSAESHPGGRRFESA